MFDRKKYIYTVYIGECFLLDFAFKDRPSTTHTLILGVEGLSSILGGIRKLLFGDHRPHTPTPALRACFFGHTDPRCLGCGSQKALQGMCVVVFHVLHRPLFALRVGPCRVSQYIPLEEEFSRLLVI